MQAFLRMWRPVVCSNPVFIVNLWIVWFWSTFSNSDKVSTVSSFTLRQPGHPCLAHIGFHRLRSWPGVQQFGRIIRNPQSPYENLEKIGLLSVLSQFCFSVMLAAPTSKTFFQQNAETKRKLRLCSYLSLLRRVTLVGRPHSFWS